MVFLDRAIRAQVFAITPLVRGGVCLVRFRVRIVSQFDIRLHAQAAITEQRLFFLKPEDNALFRRQPTPKIIGGFAFLRGVFPCQ